MFFSTAAWSEPSAMPDDAQPTAPLLLRRDADGIAWLTLNRPQARNALSMALMQALDAELAVIATDPATKVVVIAGAGPGSFALAVALAQNV